MKKALGHISLIAAGVFVAHATSATTFDFEAAGAAGDQGFETYVVSQDGLTLTATASSIDGTETYYPYLDDEYNGLPGGLGVCKEFTDECGEAAVDDTADDNIGFNEMITLMFDTEVTIEQMLFRNRLHEAEFAEGADFALSIDGGDFMSYDLEHVFDTSVTGTEFRLAAAYDETVDGYDRMYLGQLTATAAEVPEPATFGLFGAGLAALGFARRRKA